MENTEDVLSESTKKTIDGMDYESMLLQWRFSRSGDPMFQGAKGDYFKKVMFEKRDAIGAGAAVAASKSVGWGD